MRHKTLDASPLVLKNNDRSDTEEEFPSSVDRLTARGERRDSEQYGSNCAGRALIFFKDRKNKKKRNLVGDDHILQFSPPSIRHTGP